MKLTLRHWRPLVWRLLTQHTGWLTLVSAASFLVLWVAIVYIGRYQPFILPLPTAVWEEFVVMLRDGRLPRHTLYTISEVIPGLLIGIAIALPIGYLLAKSAVAENLISPYLVASRAIPVIAIAPLLTIWIRSVYWGRVTVAVIVVFFPILINVITGLRSVPAELYDLMRSLRASRWQIFTQLELPASLPILLAGLKVGATAAVIGALVGEFVRPRSEGLGYLLLSARAQFKTDSVFAILFVLGAMSLIMYGLILLLERRWLHWQNTQN